MKKLLTFLMLLCFGIGAWAIEAGKVYTIKAHFSSYNDLYFTVRGGALSFDIMRAANDNVYKWTAEATDDSSHPWAFKNVATNKYLSGTTGVADTKVGFKLTDQSDDKAGYCLMRGVADGTDRNLGTWASSDNDQTKGFGQYNHGCYSTSGTADGNWTTYYEIKEADDEVEWYQMQMTATSEMYIYATGANESGSVYVKQGTTAPTDATRGMYMWKLEGDATHGYKVINKGTGKMIACNDLSVTNGNTKAVLVDSETEGLFTRFAMGLYNENLQVLTSSGGTGLYLCAFSKNYSETRFYGTKHSTCNVKVTPVEIVEDVPSGDETIIYNPNCQKYVTNTLASNSNVANAATFIKVDCGANATYSGQQYPKFKLYVEGKGWVNSTNLTEGANRFSFSSTAACEFIYVGNDIIPVSIIGTDGSGGHGQLSWNWHGGASDSNVMGLYGQGDGNSNWAFCKQYTVSYTGLQNAEEGGITYSRANYTGTEMLLPSPIDESALIAMHVSGYNGAVSVDEANKTITVTYDQNNTETSVLWPGNGGNTNLPSARIPAIVKAYNGDLLAFSDWRYSRDDIGRNGHLDIEMRRSSDNGVTWSPLQIVANGTGVAGAPDCAYGDAAVLADHEKGDVLLMCAAGSVRSSDSNRSNPTRVARFVSHDNGQTWSGPEDMTAQFYGLITDGNAMFNTSGKLLQSKIIKKEGASHYRIYSPIAVLGGNNRVLYSDDFGATWHVLGDAMAQNSNDECRVCELPNGDILLETRIAGGRRVNLFTYTDQQTAAGSWGTVGQNTGTPATACNGDIDVVTAYKAGTNQTVTLVLETAARQGSPRSHVKYYYRALEKTTGFTLADFTSGWVEGYEVNAGKSAYSSIVYLEDEGKEAILFEDAESEDVTGYDSNPWGYDIKFEKHDISLITNNAYFAEDPSVAQTIVAILSDGNGNTFEHEYQGTVGTLPTVPAYCTVATDGTWAKVDDHFTYTADITMPFVVSNAENVKYYNIYYPIAKGSAPCYLYYNSNNASQLRNDHSVTDKVVDDAQVMTASQENTYKYSWAIYGDPFTGFTFKNRQSETFINIAGASASGTQNANLAAEGSVFTLDYATSGTYNGRWTMQSGTGYIVLWSWGNDVATYNTNANHQGGHFYLVEAPDFEAMTTTLGEECDGLGTTLGTYAYTGSQEDLNTAKSIVAGQQAPTNAKQLKTLITALTDGRGDLNMPQPGTFLRLKSHKFGTYLNSATVNWNGNSNLLTLVNGKTGDNEKTTIMYLTEDRHLVTYATGMGLCNSIQIKTANSDPYEGNTVLTFTADSKNNVGCYNIKGTYGSTNNYLYGYSDKLARNGSVTDECVWELEEVEELPVSIGTTKFSTFYTPVEVQVPAGVTAYVSKLDGEDLHVYTCKQTDGEHTLIPAGTAVMLNAAGQTDATVYSFAIPAESQAEAYENNSFFGNVFTKVFDEEYIYYSLQKDTQSNTVSFFIKPEGNFKAFQAFLKTSASQASNRLNIHFEGDDVPTGIIDLLGIENAIIPAYDLSGRRANANSKNGVFILNGKKVIK